MSNDTNKITEFRGYNFFLSNFFPAPVEYMGMRFRNSEAAFQAAKCPERAAEFCELDPSMAKARGRRVPLREDWEEVKYNVMREVVTAKFTQNEDLRIMLLNTGDAELVEGNTWKDTTWGVYKGKGKNLLGRILMEVREELRR